MSDRTSKDTVYRSYVFSNLPPTVASGGGLYTYSELAAMVGLKPTQHFRRRVKELVDNGKLQLVPAFTPRGGLEARFTIPSPAIEQEFPF